jgi:hypothetical protein
MSQERKHGQDILAVWNDVDPAHEGEYHRWYWGQHLPERLSVPGFLSAHRYLAVEAQPKFFTWYYVRDIEVLRSPYYLERLGNPTAWTQTIMPSFRNMTRCACRITTDMGRGLGGAIAVARISGAAASPERTAALDAAVAGVAEAAGNAVTRAQAWQTDPVISVQRTPEQALRGEPDRLVDYALVLHCPTVDSAREAAKSLRSAAAAVVGDKTIDGPHLYSFMHSLSVAG